MTQEINSANGTEPSEFQAKTYTQEEFDSHMAKMKSSITRKIESKYEALGDIDELIQIRNESEKLKQEQALKRGDFERVLQETVAKKDSTINQLQDTIKGYKITTPILEAASKHRAVNPDQVKSLLINNLRLNDEGEVEVVDSKGSVRYSEQGTLLSVDDAVSEFLKSNPHFVAPTPSTSATKHSITSKSTVLDVSKLDMSKPEDRQIYREYRKQNGIR